ncbi:thermonuclease family protein [Candidatus Oleimmundimicrobium sp.]|uniref:thermonuclease family protein n=1 Tax=Candidatus Oleimmundimicrobium sp. TaxID=3060597 RepID=UPI00272570B5|nr:thermonuclease family protein [Candidatus Oleimmundimicrobium sp.]MDO8886687.1 thermonuclease family protein [Candidatus Oleimmundimicrobium sp.]
MKKALDWFKGLSILGKALVIIGAFFALSVFAVAVSPPEETTPPPKKETVAEQPAEKTEEEGEKPKKELSYEIVTCVRAVDGDTIEVEIDGKTYKVRYIGIDTPELHHPSKPVEEYAQEAYEFNKSLVEGKEVRLVKDISEVDKYNRFLRYVYVGDLFVNAELVKQGYAHASTYPPDVAHEDEFRELETQARNDLLGLWAPETEEPPKAAEEPKEEEKKEVTVYITNTGECYHRSGCSSLSKSCIPISLNDAKAKGYRPCKRCNPPQ